MLRCTPRRVRCALFVVLVAGALLSASAGNANFARPQGAILAGSSPASSAGAPCTPSGSRLRSQRSTRSSTIHSYDDFVEDVQSAPDICSSNIVTNDNLAVMMGIHIHDRPAFSVDDGYRIYLDTDSDPATGSGALPGEPAGAELLIEILDGTSTLRRWSGTSFDQLTPQPAISTEWIDGYGPALEIGRKDLGEVQSFTFVIVTSNGADHDLAPDAGSWSYTLSELELAPGRLAVGQAKAGKPLVARMVVVRSDFDVALEEGAIKCSAEIGGKRLGGEGAFADERVRCTWRLPTSARGKRLRGSVAVTFQGVTAKRSFNVRVS